MEPIISNSEDETFRLAREYAGTVKPGDVICLEGDLGAGKTHFVKGFAEHFGVQRDEVSSPTFTIINEYDGEVPVYHFDCYRLENPAEALEIGAEEYLYGTGVCIIEWPERISELIPAGARRITLTSLSPNRRRIEYHN